MAAALMATSAVFCHLPSAICHLLRT